MRTLWEAFLQLFFRLLYNEFAWAYDIVAWVVSLGRWTEWGQAAIPHIRGKRTLELGHGPGHLLAALEKQDLDPVGVDASPHMGHRARSLLGNAGLSVPLIRARAQALPFRDLCFDTIVATFPTDFILDPKTLEEVTRALREGGQLVTALGVRFDGEGLMATILTRLYRATGQDTPDVTGFVDLLADHGLMPEMIYERVGQTTVLLVVSEKP